MAWLSRVNFISSDTLSFTDVNNLGNDIRAWGDNVNGGGYTLSNVAISASSGTMATVTGGTGAASTLTLRSTSGVGTSDAIVFVTGNAGANEALRLNSSGSANFGKIWTSGAQATGNVALSRGDLVSFGTSLDGAALTWDVQTTAGNASVMARLRPRWIANLSYALDVFAGGWNNAYDPGSAVATFQSTGNVGIGTASPGRLLDVRGLSAFSDGTQGLILGPYTGGSGYSAIYNFGTTPGSANYLFASNTSETILNNATRLVFAIGAIEKMRIDSSGNVLIGYTTSNGSYLLQVNSQIFATNATIATSDGRYKENISPIKSGLGVVGKLNPVSFTWKQHEIHNFDSGTQVGFIAQDVQAALADEPYLESVVKSNEVELKDGTKEEFYGLSDAKLIPILVKAIQELKAKIDILEARN